MRNVATSLLLLLLAGGAVLAQDANEQPLSGRVQPVQVTELRVDLEGYGGELKLKTLLAPGMAVKKGDVVAELEAPDYKDALDRARENVTLSEMTAKQLEDSLNYAEESYKQQLERAQRNADRAAQDYDYFVNKQRKETIRNSELGLESAENNITDQEEELKQLESLYKGNDLAKESQDIVLNRSKRRLKVSKERYGQAKEHHQRLVDVDLKRREEDMLANKESAALELASLKSESRAKNFDLSGKLTRVRRGLADAKKALADLEADAGRFKLVAPHDGLVAVGGWGGNDGAQQPFKVGDDVNRGQVLATIVDQTKLTLSVNVKLDAREKFAPGTQVKVGDAGMTGTVKAIGFIVNKGGMVTARVEIENPDGKLLPGQEVSIALP
ncbi:MAG: HlyD family efflux transporter periplasmic adaptor subunit [Planctomycetes bacterium]|nr:HlyD family efflux transporter periplasmic adaptor subunit [Planctomycetota bacterium]